MDKRKVEIVEAALNRFSHYGFAKTTMNEIAEDLFITKANLYYYYQDKTALICDVMWYLSNQLFELEKEIIKNFKEDFLGTLNALLELRSGFMSKYYMLHINENLEWVKGLNVTKTIREIYKIEYSNLLVLFKNAVKSGVLKVENIEEAARSYIEINRGLSLMFNLQDIITGIPNKENVEKILDSQKRAAKLIFADKLITKVKQ